MSNANQTHPDLELKNSSLPPNMQIQPGGKLVFPENDPRHDIRLSVVDLLSFPKDPRGTNGFETEISDLIKTITNQETINFADLEAAITNSLEFWNDFLDIPNLSDGARKATDALQTMLNNSSSVNKGEKEGVMTRIRNLNRHIKNKATSPTINDLEVVTMKGIADFVRQATAFDKKLYGPYICAFLKIVMAFVHLQQHFKQEDRIEKLTEKFETDLFASIQTYEEITNGWKSREIRTKEGKKIKLSTTSRAKSFWRIAAKLLKALENNYADSIKDLIGLRSELSADDFIDTFVTLSQELQRQGAKLQKMRYRFKNKDEDDINYHFFTDKQDIQNRGFPKTEAKQHDNFEDVRIIGTWMNENFEIQLIPFGHDNEIGVSHHKVHEELGKLEVLFRLFGAIPFEWIQRSMKKAYDAASNDMAWRENTINTDANEVADSGNMKMTKKETKRAMKSANIILYDGIKARFSKDLVVLDNGRRVISKTELKNLHSLYGDKMPQKYKDVYHEVFGEKNLSTNSAAG